MNPLIVLSSLLALASANPLKFPGQGGLSLTQRVPNPCSTLEGTACVFPFTYDGVEYYQCTYKNSPTPWCATKLDPNGTVIVNNWGDCANTQTSACPVEDLTKPTCTAVSGSACVFPFRYKGIVYNKCSDAANTEISDSQAWCSTEVTSGGEHIDGKAAVCPNTCEGAASNTATAATTTTTTTTTTTAASSSASTTTTTTTTASTTTTTTTTTTTAASVNTNSLKSGCTTASGPAAGKQCIFPFKFQGVTYSGCAEWVYGGENQGKSWCSTMVNPSGEHMDGNSQWGICPDTCQKHSAFDFL